jgi:hypothetical protein
MELTGHLRMKLTGPLGEQLFWCNINIQYHMMLIFTVHVNPELLESSFQVLNSLPHYVKHLQGCQTFKAVSHLNSNTFFHNLNHSGTGTLSHPSSSRLTRTVSCVKLAVSSLHRVQNPDIAH